ncbi:MAG TPA: hypothetical protein P5248_08995 [Bacteroidales bacterium]|nr:hypothetical protein [Bacteroidales bacterium]
MAYSVINGVLPSSTTGGGGATSWFSSSQALSAHKTNIVIVRSYDVIGTRGDVASITDTAGNTYVRLGPVNTDPVSDAGRNEMWAAFDTIEHASNVIEVHFSVAVSHGRAIIAQYDGIGAYDGGYGFNLSDGGTTHSSASITTAADGALLVSAAFTYTGPTSTYGSVAPAVVQISGGGNAIIDRVVGGGAGLYNSQFSTTDDCQKAIITRSFSPEEAGDPTGHVKAYSGTIWVPKPVKVWNGSAWVTKPLKRWNGAAWV